MASVPVTPPATKDKREKLIAKKDQLVLNLADFEKVIPGTTKKRKDINKLAYDELKREIASIDMQVRALGGKRRTRRQHKRKQQRKTSHRRK
jgi:hypothetical protein